MKRILLDLFVILTALCAGPILVRMLRNRLQREYLLALRALIAAGSVLLLSGLVVLLLQAVENELGFRWLLASGVAFAWGVALVAATGLCYILLKIPTPVAPARRRLLTLASTAAITAPAATLGYGMFIGRRQFHLKEVDLAIPNLAPDIDGLRIAHLSDIHLSPFLSRADLQWCVDMANETRPQIAAVTGDLITGVRDSIDDCLTDLRRLRADAGIFGCTGNHELYIRAEAYTAERAARLGMKFLRHEQASLRFGSTTINIAGVDHKDNPWAFRPTAALLRPGEFNLLLNHNPTMFPSIVKQGWDVTLSGHMHGGQINLELANANWNLARFSTPYIYGTYRERNSTMFVTRGIGTIGMPVRLGAPPEVALITLRK
ncbi:MAG: metallophosphoesterase [Bryobacteraceae bacterium]